MKRWNRSVRDFIEAPDIDAFLEEVLMVCRKHGLWLSHEDERGRFEVVSKVDADEGWLLAAADERTQSE